MDASQPGNLRSSVDCSNFGVIEAQTLSNLVSIDGRRAEQFHLDFRIVRWIINVS